jgi:hypothetical protein
MLIARRAMAGICRFVPLLLHRRFCFSVRHERASRNDGAQVDDYLTAQRTTGRRHCRSEKTANLLARVHNAALEPLGLEFSQSSTLCAVALEQSDSITELGGALGVERSTLTRNWSAMILSSCRSARDEGRDIA